MTDELRFIHVRCQLPGGIFEKQVRIQPIIHSSGLEWTIDRTFSLAFDLAI